MVPKNGNKSTVTSTSLKKAASQKVTKSSSSSTPTSSSASTPDSPSVTELTCSICFDEIKKEDLTSIDSCIHLFCFSCIEQWSKVRVGWSSRGEKKLGVSFHLTPFQSPFCNPPIAARDHLPSLQVQVQAAQQG